MSEGIRDLLVRGVAAAKAGDKKEARFYLEWVLRLEPPEEQRAKALFWLSQVSDDPDRKRRYLEDVLALDPIHPEAQRALAVLDGRLRPDEMIDPNRLNIAASDTPQPAQLQRFVCPDCGGRMVYDPQGQLICEYCAQHKATPTSAAEGSSIDEQDFVLALATTRGHVPPIATHCLRCRACGAQFTLPPETLSFTCPYCAAAYAVEQMEVQELVPPAAILPFVIDQVTAGRIVSRWLQQARSADLIEVAPLTGMYFPAWTFDILCRVTDTSTGQIGEFQADDVPVPASRRLPPSLADEVANFNLEALVAYDPRYLAGWPAETYQISPADASLVARQKVAASRFQVTVRLSLSVLAFKLILLPLWITHCRNKKQRYTVIVNGQTGSLRSDKPEEGIRGWLRRLAGGMD